MRRNPGPTARLPEKITALVDTLVRGAERLVGDLAAGPQPQLVPVRVRTGRRGSIQ